MRNEPIQLTENFTLQELIKSQVAARKGIDNTPNFEQILALNNLARNVLQPARDAIGVPIVLSSGFRSPQLNEEIGGSNDSQHMEGQAVDCEAIGFDNAELAKIIFDEAPFGVDQLILEHYDGIDPNSGWVHVSFVSFEENRNQILTYSDKGYVEITFDELLNLCN